MSRDTTVPRERGQFWQVQMGLTQPLLSPPVGAPVPGRSEPFDQRSSDLAGIFTANGEHLAFRLRARGGRLVDNCDEIGCTAPMVRASSPATVHHGRTAGCQLADCAATSRVIGRGRRYAESHGHAWRAWSTR